MEHDEVLTKLILTCDGTPESKAEVYKAAVDYFDKLLDVAKGVKTPSEAVCNFLTLVKIFSDIAGLATIDTFTRQEWYNNVEVPVVKNAARRTLKLVGSH